VLSAKISDPDGDRVFLNMNVKKADGTMYWNGATTETSYTSGTVASRTVPSGSALTTGSYYSEAQAKDTAGNWGPWSTCKFSIDVTPPATPTVKPMTGQPAVYTTGTETGGIGVVGKFTVGPNGSTDVDHFEYGWDPAAIKEPVDGTTITYSPDSAGPHTLYVKSIDRAGNASKTPAIYKIDVAYPSETAAWQLEEGAGMVGVDYLGRQNLALSNSTMWGAGPTTAEPGSKALVLGGADDFAQTLGPVVHTDKSFVVAAHVRLDQLNEHAVAVSQDATQRSGFKLGYMPGSRCPTVDGPGCWTFTMPRSDGGTLVEARSEFKVAANKWMYLVGSFDAVAKTATLSVCDPSPSILNPAKVEKVSTGFDANPWFAKGALQVGRGMHGGVHNDPWVGAVDNVRVWDGQLLDTAGAKILRLCDGAPMYSSTPDVPDTNDPTVDTAG